MNRKPFTAVLVLSIAAAAGCNFKDEKPRGAGASGRPLTVLGKPQVDMERFFKYNEEHEKVIQLLEQPFDAVVKPGPGAADPKAKAVTEKVKQNWGEFKFVVPKEGRTFRYRAVISTNLGDLVIDFFEGHTPDVVRNFITRLKNRVHDGQPILVEGDALVFGAPLDKQAYTVPARPLSAPLPKGAVFAYLLDDRASGERFGISLNEVPGGASKVSIFGHVANPSMNAVLAQFLKESTKQPGSVVIKSVRIDVFEKPIFEGPEVRLPRLDKKGNLDTPDLPTYTGVANPDTSPHEPAMKGRKMPTNADVGASIDPSIIPSKNPNVPPSKDDKQSPKSP
jgi:hypothetical protein